jgi:hypothetical protein
MSTLVSSAEMAEFLQEDNSQSEGWRMVAQELESTLGALSVDLRLYRAFVNNPPKWSVSPSDLEASFLETVKTKRSLAERPRKAWVAVVYQAWRGEEKRINKVIRDLWSEERKKILKDYRWLEQEGAIALIELLEALGAHIVASGREPVLPEGAIADSVNRIATLAGFTEIEVHIGAHVDFKTQERRATWAPIPDLSRDGMVIGIAKPGFVKRGRLVRKATVVRGSVLDHVFAS